ncbi:DEAD/DEAH box helicase [Neoaquamicrobium sediminum]|uniref:DEAD/DEAH box helicase family protein n=1 Tax=Neoaquamicrobium sediminum TaxID=1849104 RepID=A0ABV3WQ20_9HYPH
MSGLRELDYQDRVLTTFDAFLDALGEEKVKADKVAELARQQPDLDLAIPDFPARAWEKLKADSKLPQSRADIPYSSRRSGSGQPVPNAVLKVPTGGGKTFLAVNAVSRILGRYINRNTGFVLWIVPNEAIYTQTLKRLKDRQDPYRQALDRAAVGRVRIMEKSDPLNARDVEGQLCVMLLMLQSANRQTKETLKMFQDRGDVHGFMPPEGDQSAHAELIGQVSNLDAYNDIFPMVKDSLGNALRIIRPIVVLDEGHKAISQLAHDTLYGFNPLFVLELTATPQDVKGKDDAPARHANVLVEITGIELDREGMIKMPLNLDARQGTDWKATLNVAVDRLNALDDEARKLRANTGRYIRPIMLVQVERTGADQRDGDHIHALDVKDRLLALGFDEAEIAIKTAEVNDLSQPENQDLLSPTNKVRAIITKQALQEGWDCPFAYVLCALAASTGKSALTQLVGRILRQPHATKTEVDPLDECHVITHHAATGDVVATIKKGLEGDGLGDLVLKVADGGQDGPPPGTARRIERRKDFASTRIYLPRVLRIEGAVVRPLDYETDILAAIDWRGFDAAGIADTIPENAQPVANQLQRISLTETKEHFAQQTVSVLADGIAFDPSYAVRNISDIVPNPFVGREIVESVLARLGARGFDADRIGQLGTLIIEELRKGLDKERAARAETLFRQQVANGVIQFRLRLDGRNWQMPFAVETSEPEGARTLAGKDGGPLEKSLFSPVYENELNKDERAVAVHLDAEEALAWWHRNAARAHYGLQGWRRAMIYPDFIFAVKREGAGARITVLETKGNQLDNLDTAYKRDVLNVLSENFAWDATAPAGTLELVQDNGETVECTLILMSEWKTKLPGHLQAT